MSHGYQNRRICAVQAFCAAKSWRRWNSLPPSILITLGLSRLRRVKQKKRAEWRVTSVFALRKPWCTSNSFVCALLNVPRIPKPAHLRRASILRSKILAEVGFTSTEHLNHPWVEPPAAAKPKKKRQPTVVSSFLVDLKGFEPTTLRMRTVRSPN